MVLKPGVVNLCTSINTLKNIDLSEKANFLKAKEIKLGFGARECIKNLKKSNLLSSQNLASKLFDRSPLESAIVRNADALNPNVIADLEAHLLERKIESDSFTFAQVEHSLF